MNILHAHYQPPQKPEETGGILFWLETSDVPALKSRRTAKKEMSRLHPFCADAITLKHLLNIVEVSKNDRTAPAQRQRDSPALAE